MELPYELWSKVYSRPQELSSLIRDATLTEYYLATKDNPITQKEVEKVLRNSLEVFFVLNVDRTTCYIITYLYNMYVSAGYPTDLRAILGIEYVSDGNITHLKMDSVDGYDGKNFDEIVFSFNEECVNMSLLKKIYENRKSLMEINPNYAKEKVKEAHNKAMNLLSHNMYFVYAYLSSQLKFFGKDVDLSPLSYTRENEKMLLELESLI